MSSFLVTNFFCKIIVIIPQAAKSIGTGILFQDNDLESVDINVGTIYTAKNPS
jgi:hypothetical protein